MIQIPANPVIQAEPPVVVPPQAASPAPVTTEERALNQAVGAAVRTLNVAVAAGDGREITWSFDSHSRRPVVKVLDSLTREVIVQWPTQYALDLALAQNTRQGETQHG